MRGPPAERLVERAGAQEIGDTKGHQADPLIHADSFAARRRLRQPISVA